MKIRTTLIALISTLAAAFTVASPARANWFGWENLGGIILEEPDCKSWSANRIDCFARGTDRAMYHRWWNGASWGGWENLGGIILEEPECVSWSSNRLDCFARGTDRAMYHRWWNGSSWGGWENLGGVILESPECVSWGQNRIDCFARGTDRAMYHRWWNGSSWGGWENLGGTILEQPECTSWGPNRIDCFARGTDRAMYHRWWNGSSWGGWENLGGIILEQPECTTWSSNRIDCFARGTDRAMYHRWWNGSSWGGWENLGGIILEQPSCTSWSANRIDCFARGTDRAMYHRWFTPSPGRTITVSRRNTVSLSNAEVDSLLADGSTALQTNDGNGDIACDVNIGRSGNITTFTNGDGSIDTQAELTEIFGLAGNVKVVGDVNWCANMFNTSFIGCGQTPGTSFITERFTANQEGLLWTHEFGHNQGLPHRTDSNNNVMFPSIGTNRRNVNQTECNAYRGSSPATAGAMQEVAMTSDPAALTDAMPAGGKMDAVLATDAANTMPAGGTPDSTLVAPDNAMPAADAQSGTMQNSGDDATIAMPGGGMANTANAADKAEQLPPVAEFVSQIYYEGLPLDKAALYTEADADILLAMLNDASQAQYHENIALTLGMIGSSKSVAPLIAYLKSGPTDNASKSIDETNVRPVYRGRIGAIMALGYILNKTGDKAALDYLIESTTPSTWKSRDLVSSPGASDTTENLPEDLSKYAIFSLGLSGNADAATHLRSLVGSKDLDVSTQVLKDAIAQSLLLSDDVAKKGLVEYYRTDK